MQPKARTLSALLISLVLLVTRSASAETIIIESRTTGGTTGGITPYPPYQETPTTGWSGSGSHTTAPGVTSGVGSRFAFSGTPSLRLTPTLQPGSTYRLSISHITINASPNIVVNVTYEGCTGTATSTTNFNSARGNVWEVVGDITVDPGVTQPSIIFTYASGTLASTGGRWYSDAFKFQNDPCIFSTLPELVGPTGPLAEGQTFVNVPGIAAGATAVSVYADGILIGQKTAAVTAGLNRVDTITPLVKGQIITATQSDANGVECCRPNQGPIAGSGANPPVRMALSIRQDTTLTGPAGANGGGGSTIIKFLGATNIASGGAPQGTRVFYPSNDWQTIEFLRGDNPESPVDSTFLWNGTDATNPNQLKGNFGVLDGIGFTVGDSSGPYAIYIDKFMSGSTLIQSFEDSGPGANEVLFTQPGFSGTTSPFLLSTAAGVISPNSSMVTNNTADDGGHSLFVSWQFKDTNAVNWLRLASPSAAVGTPNPMVDLRLPITFRMLILPVGVEPAPSAPVFAFGPGNQTVVRGGRITLRANVKGTSPFTYQWLFNGNEILNATNRTLTLTSVQPSASGQYSLRASNGLGTSTSPEGTLTVEDVPYSDVMSPLWSLAPGSRRYLTNDNNTTSIAYNFATGHLLVASRSPSNAVQVLDGDTGAHLHTMSLPLNGFVGPLAVNRVACADDGSVYVGNITEDGVTNNFRLYKWLGDDPSEVGALVWEGNPSASPDIHARWGDAMAVQGASGDHEVILSSSTGAYLASIRPDFTGSPAQLMEVSGLASGTLRIGLAWDDANTVFGKNRGLPLTRVTLDPNRINATLAQTYPGLANMTAIDVDPVNRLLAGVFVENPDNLRLFEIRANSLEPLDTEFFPTDNANANGTGAVAFAPGRVYALDSNNGILAMSLNLACLPDRLTIERDAEIAIISWNRLGQRLQGTAVLGSGVWDEIAGPSQTYATVPSGSGMKFFRLVCP